MMLRFGFHRGHQTKCKTVAKTRAVIKVEVQGGKKTWKEKKSLRIVQLPKLGSCVACCIFLSLRFVVWVRLYPGLLVILCQEK